MKKSDSGPEDLKLKSAKMAEVDKQAPGLPDEVPKELRMELERLQRQIKVLLNNYQVRIFGDMRMGWLHGNVCFLSVIVYDLFHVHCFV